MIASIKLFSYKLLIIQSIVFGVLIIASCNSVAQTITTQSKNCGACNRQVSNNSRPGMRCPHCGVRWGGENTSYTQSYSHSIDNFNYSAPDIFGYSSKFGITNSRANVRVGPGKDYYVQDVLDDFTNVTILERIGNWYKVTYNQYSSWGIVERTGYVHKSLIN